jgi:hypothetical protein
MSPQYVHQAHDLEEFTEGPNPTICGPCLHPFHGTTRCRAFENPSDRDGVQCDCKGVEE